MLDLSDAAKTTAWAMSFVRPAVNTIAPGPINSPLLRASVHGGAEGDFAATWKDLPMKRIGRAAEIASAAAYLVGKDAAFVTGATIDVNGGMSMR